VSFDPIEIERRWQARWEADGLHTADIDAGRVFYNLVEFPYPSAEGLHVGHVRTYAGADAYGRYRRMRGYEVFQPMGFDSFGINAENYALKVGEQPRTLISRTITNFRRQLSGFGAAWDWSRTVVTSDPSYYRWTQWIFLRLLEAGLAYRASAPVVWCPSCLTVLAREQLDGDRCERCDTRVTERVMEQWFLRITFYADALVDGLDALDWPQWAKRQQREWIGRSPGVEFDFEVPDRGITLTCFTTRPDTLYGVTFLAVAPTHPDLGRGGALVRDRFGTTTEGHDTGVRAIHPLTGAGLPVFCADYVVGGYGTGAVMGVPAHDARDHAFALAHGLTVRRVIDGGELPYAGSGVLVDSGPYTGMASERASEAITDAVGRRVVRYRLHDWLISRQRYWGPPIPVVYCDGCGVVGVRDGDLPVLLPDVADVRPAGTGTSPLAAVEAFVRTVCPSCGGEARRETDVSDTFLDSSWYYLRYTSTDLDDRPWDPDRVRTVDRYEGGREHVTRHHLYARFVCHALFDLGLVPFREPFPGLSFHGLMVLEGAKMSKSRGNVVSPDDYVDSVGADALRLALLFTGPWEEGPVFADAGVAGMVRFQRRIWRLITEPQTSGAGADMRPLHRAIARVTADIESYDFHTAIAALMECVRWAETAEMTAEQHAEAAGVLVRLLAPFAPHLAEELWASIGGPYSVHRASWPDADPDAHREDTVTLVVQVDGRRRDSFEVPAGLPEAEAVALALSRDAVRRLLDGDPARIVYVPDRLVNLVSR
jgi:leucyl-tRNA synthetase